VIPPQGAVRTQEIDAPRLARAALLLIVSYVFLANHWVGDDAYITLRTVDNFLHGYGLRWNIDERVQTYTHPLWMLLLLITSFITREYFLTTVMLGLTLSVLAVVILGTRVSKTRPGACVAVVALSLSRAFGDYSSSGLENPLTHLLLALFLAGAIPVAAGLVAIAAARRRLLERAEVAEALA